MRDKKIYKNFSLHFLLTATDNLYLNLSRFSVVRDKLVDTRRPALDRHKMFIKTNECLFKLMYLH